MRKSCSRSHISLARPVNTLLVPLLWKTYVPYTVHRLYMSSIVYEARYVSGSLTLRPMSFVSTMWARRRRSSCFWPAVRPPSAHDRNARATPCSSRCATGTAKKFMADR